MNPNILPFYLISYNTVARRDASAVQCICLSCRNGKQHSHSRALKAHPPAVTIKSLGSKRAGRFRPQRYCQKQRFAFRHNMWHCAGFLRSPQSTMPRQEPVSCLQKTQDVLYIRQLRGKSVNTSRVSISAFCE